jgi:hypothetical protein
MHHSPQRLLDPAAGQAGQGLPHDVGALTVREQLAHMVSGQDDYFHEGPPARTGNG